MQKKDNRLIKHLTLIGLIGSSFIPKVSIGIDIYIVTIIPIVLLVLLIISRNMILSLNKYVYLYSLLLLTMFISIVYSYIFLNVPPIYRDFMEWLKYLQFLPYFLVIGYVNYGCLMRTLNKYVKFISIFILVVIFFEYTDLFTIGHLIGGIYTPPDGNHFTAMFSSTNRLVGTGGDPNIGAMIISFFLVFNINDYFQTKSVSKLIFSILLLFSVLLTQSRTVLIGLFGASLFVLFIVSRSNIFFKLLYLISIIIIIYSVFNLFEFNYIKVGIESVLQGQNNSLNERLENYRLAIERFQESPFFGIGPAKAITNTVIDGEYALIIQRYGLIGSLMFIILFISVFRDLLKIIKINSEVIILLIYIILCLFFMFTNNVLAGYQIGGFVILIIIIINLHKNQEELLYEK